MKDLINRNIFNLALLVLFLGFTAVSFFIDFQPGEEIFREQFMLFFREMILFLPVMFILIGLGDVWIDREKVERHVGSESGLKGIALFILLSMAQAGPLYGAFPVAYLLWKKGSSIRNIFIYIGAFCTIKIPMLTFEIGFLGWKFSLLRTILTLPMIILIGVLMERYLKNKKFVIKD